MISVMGYGFQGQGQTMDRCCEITGSKVATFLDGPYTVFQHP